MRQEASGSTRRMDGGMARSRDALMRDHISWGCWRRRPVVLLSKSGKEARDAARSWSWASAALDLMFMRMARRSTSVAMAWAVGDAEPLSVAIKHSMAPTYSLGVVLMRSRK